MSSARSIDEPSLTFCEFTIDLKRHGLYRGDERVRLTPTPFGVLTYLARNCGRIISKEELLQAVWGQQRDANTVEQAVLKIRRALKDDTEQPRFIQTIPGEGYRFVAPVSAVQEINPNGSIDVPLITSVRTDNAAKRLVPRISLAAILLGSAVLGLVAFYRPAPNLSVSSPMRIVESQTILSPLLNDGSLIFYPDYMKGKYGLKNVSVDGGQGTTLATGLSNPELCDFSVKNHATLLRDIQGTRDEDAPLYVKFADHPAQRVGNLSVYDAAWLPDAKAILYSTGGSVFFDRFGWTHSQKTVQRSWQCLLVQMVA